MEWDSKTFAWNGVNKLEIQDNTYHPHHHHHHHQLGSLTGSNDSGITNMFSVDLKLGRLEDVSMEKSLKQAIPQFNMSSSSSSSTSPILALSKRGRPRNSGAQNNVFCSVDGCTSDLHQGREYHRRHKVCERHSKTPVVLVGGKEQRFCQQCSRFHSLEEFDEVKRSCRKRLDGHNRRRRKRQPEAFYTPNNAGGFISSHTGEGMLQFCCPQINTTNWATTLSQPDMYFRNIQDPIYQPLLNSISATTNRRGSLKIPPENNSNCALSLLSRYTPQPSDICVGPNLQTSTLSLSATQISSTELNLNSLVQVSLSQGLEYMQNSGSISENTSANAHSFGGFHSSTHDEFNENGSSSRIFPFGWE